MHNLGYFLKEAFIGFKRNLGTTLGSIITIFLSLFIIGVFLVAGNIVNNIVESIENEVSITIYIADDADPAKVQKLQDSIKGMSGVDEVTYMSKDEALESFKESMSSNQDIINQLESNPLPASIGVNMTDPQQVTEIAQKIEASDLFKAVCDNPANPSDSIKYGQKTVEKLFAVTNYIRYIGIALIILLIFIALVFINNTIRLAILARSKEISIMRLVGASNGFIRGPFLTEGALHAVIGAILAAAVIEILRRVLLPQFTTAFTWLPINLSNGTFLLIYLLLLVAGIIIGLLGSALAMRKYLKV